MASFSGNDECWTENDRVKFIKNIKEHLWQNLSLDSKKSEFLVKLCAFCGLTKSEEKLILKVFYLLSDEFERAVKTLPMLKYEFERDSVLKTHTDFRIKGKILWSKTILSRYNGDFTSFVLLNDFFDFETRQNVELLKFLLQAKSDLEEIIGRWKNEKNSSWIKHFEFYLGEILSFIKMPNVLPIVTKIDLRNLNIDRSVLYIMSNHHKSSYRSIYHAINRYLKLKTKSNKEIRRAIETFVLEPASNNTLYELGALFIVLENFEKKVGKGEYRLIQSQSSGPVAIFSTNKFRISIYYQINPIQRSNSLYLQLAKNTGLDPKIRQPDIIIVKETDDDSDYKELWIIELKLSNKQKYIRDSIYKVFGYLFDFKGALIKKAFLITWEGNKSNKLILNDNAEIMITNWIDFNKNFPVHLASFVSK